MIDRQLELVKNKGVAEESALGFYCDVCNNILGGTALDEVALTLFNEPFANNFAEEDLLFENLPGSACVARFLNECAGR